MTHLSNVRHIVKAEVVHLQRQIAALQTSSAQQKFSTTVVKGSITLRSAATYGRKLNHTYGFGSFGPVTQEDLRTIEQAYGECGLQPELDMCEYAHATAFDLLSTGYSVTGSICQYQRHLSEMEPPLSDLGDVKISQCSDRETFIQASVEGFRSSGRSVQLLTTLAKSAAARSDTELFFATMNGQVVGTAAMAVIDVGECKAAVFFIDSTLPAARGNGVHKSLILARLQVAKEHGCAFATAGAREGSGSARNIQKAGFEKVYTTKTFTKKH